MTNPNLAVSTKHEEVPQLSKTLDLHRIAMIAKSARVEVQQVHDLTIDAFDETLKIISERGGHQPMTFSETVQLHIKQAPEDSELHKVFVFAEILGGYEAFNSVDNVNSPVNMMTVSLNEAIENRDLTTVELQRLEESHKGLKEAVENAKVYYRETHLNGLSLIEMNELYAMVNRAKAKAEEINNLIGKHLMKQIEHSVMRLHEMHKKRLGVEHSVSGIFLVEDEVLYIPVDELQHAIDVVFKGVGNKYLASHIDGVMLLAARNLLIEVVSFYAYYGKHQIYQLFKKGIDVDKKRIALRIRNEIRNILTACKEDNKLVLTRIMDKEEAQLDLSIQAIQKEAEEQAVREVVRLIPQPKAVVKKVEKKNWFQRITGWMS